MHLGSSHDITAVVMVPWAKNGQLNCSGGPCSSLIHINAHKLAGESTEASNAILSLQLHDFLHQAWLPGCSTIDLLPC